MIYSIRRVQTGILITFSLLISGYSQIADTLFPLEEVQIVSDRIGLPENRSGRHVSVIKADEIQALPVNSIDELLRYVPFMEVQSRAPFGAQSDILMRGSTFNQVLVLIDGMRINDPLTGHFNSNIPVSLTEISRIEVYRGNASPIYGPDAVGGVVNIITKTFQKGYEDKDHLDGRVEFWMGENNLKRSNSGISIRRGRWKASAGVNYSASDGQLLEPDSLRGDFRVLTPSVSLSSEISEKVQISVRTAFDKRLFNARYFYTNSPFDQSREEVSKWWNQARLSFQMSESHSMQLSAGYQTTRDSFLFNPAFPANIHRTNYQNYEINHLFKSGSGLRLASGIQMDYKNIFSNDRGDREHLHAGGYVMATKVLREEFTLGGGLRLDYDQVYGLEILPQVNLSYTSGRWIMRGSAGRSLRSPDFTERYISTGLDGPLSPGRNLGNPDLLAERAWSIEAGVDRRIMESIQFRVTGFYRFSRDLIDYVLTPAEEIPENSNLLSGESYFYTENIGLLNTGGIEAELSGSHPLDGKWTMDWTVSYQGLLTRSDSVIVSKYLASHSKNYASLSFGAGTNGFRIRMNSMYKTRDPEAAMEINQNLSKSYMLWNLRIDKYFWNRQLQLSFQVNNLFNENYSDIMGAKMPGRWILGGLTWNFHR